MFTKKDIDVFDILQRLYYVWSCANEQHSKLSKVSDAFSDGRPLLRLHAASVLEH